MEETGLRLVAAFLELLTMMPQIEVSSDWLILTDEPFDDPLALIPQGCGRRMTVFNIFEPMVAIQCSKTRWEGLNGLPVCRVHCLCMAMRH